MFSSAFAIAILAGSIATASAQSVEHLTPCAEACSQQAGVLSGCALTDPACFCKSAIFIGTVQSCEISNCTIEDQQVTLRVSARVCESVGGVAPINYTPSSSVASVTVESTTSPSTAGPSEAPVAEKDRVASILAQLPECGKICAQQASEASGCSLTDPDCFCTNKKFLVLSEACESKSCTTEEQKTIVLLSLSLCANVAGALPSINPTLNPSAAVAKLTSSTGVTLSTATATASTDAAEASASILASLPECGVPCVKAALQSSGCSLTDKVCVCQNPSFLCPVVACEAGVCSGAENDAISTYTAGYCASSGGRDFNPTCGNVTSPASSGNGSVAPGPTPSVVPYTGQAGPSLMAGGMISVLGTVLVLGAGVGVLAWM